MENKTPSKPLHRDLSFWIVVVTLVGAANMAQLYYGIPWMRAKIADVRPAPRIESSAQPAIRDVFTRVGPELDHSRKTYAWQVPRFNDAILETVPAQVVLIPSEFTAPSGGWSVTRHGKCAGIRVSAAEVLQLAFNWHHPSRIVWYESSPKGEFDFIANLNSGAAEALRSEIRSRLNLTARTELILTNVFVLRVLHTNAPGMKPSTPGNMRVQLNQGIFSMSNADIGALTGYIETLVQKPVLDQTGLTGVYDFRFPHPQNLRMAGIQVADPADYFRRTLPEHLGLELIETNAPIEMLVIKKAH